jgi:hypothetical protein
MADCSRPKGGSGLSTHLDTHEEGTGEVYERLAKGSAVNPGHRERSEDHDETPSLIECLMVGCPETVDTAAFKNAALATSSIAAVVRAKAIGRHWKEGRDVNGRRYHYHSDTWHELIPPWHEGWKDKWHELYCARHQKHNEAAGYTCGTKFPELYPMLVLDANLFISNREIPRFDDPRIAQTPGLRRKYSELQNRQDCFVIFVSHRWLSPAKDGSGHPDRPDAGHPKHALLAKAIRKLQATVLNKKTLYLWIDFR